MRYESIDEATALRHMASGEVFFLTRVTGNVTIDALLSAIGEGRVVAAHEAYKPAEPTPKEVPEEPEPKQEKVQTRGRYANAIDHGKVAALYNAGWSVKKIAEEIGCNKQTIIDHLTKEGIYKSGKDKKEAADDDGKDD